MDDYYIYIYPYPRIEAVEEIWVTGYHASLGWVYAVADAKLAPVCLLDW